jgi:hypothetical protein
MGQLTQKKTVKFGNQEKFKKIEVLNTYTSAGSARA